MLKFVLKALRLFRSDQKGSLSVEAVFAFPLLLIGATATYTFFDVFKAQNANYRANYTISDMLSRQNETVDQAFVDGLLEVYRYMTFAGGSTTWLRISVVQCVADCADESQRDLRFLWSNSSNAPANLTNADIPFYDDKIPLMATGNQLILVETLRQYRPPFPNFFVSFGERDLFTYVFTRPRFTSNLCWVTCENGDGEDESDGNPDL